MISTAVTIFSSELKSAQPLACRLIESAVAQGKIANAYLLTGRAGKDKMRLAQEAACYFNCQAAERASQGSCYARAIEPTRMCLNCQWIARHEHPQAWLMLAGEGKSQKIPVEKARQLVNELSKTSSYVRVVVVPESDEVTFHRPAANALLKLIEEPPADVLFFFFADSTEDVLATIVSRCQTVPVERALALGYWSPAEAAPGMFAPEAIQRLEAVRSNLIMQARKYFGQPDGSHQYARTVTDGLALSKELLEVCKELSENMDERVAAEQVLDLFAACELEVLREQSQCNEACARYLDKVFNLVERTKRHINQYIKQTNAIETFSLALNDLRHAYSGEIGLAKR